MADRVVFQVPNGPVIVLIPASRDMTTKQIAEKDVPSGIPYWVVDESELPSRDFRDAWTLAEVTKEPDGYGKGLQYDIN